MSDTLLYLALSTPFLIGLVALGWGLVSLVAGVVVGKAFRAADRPFDWSRDE